jgi:hypothetical protein
VPDGDSIRWMPIVPAPSEDTATLKPSAVSGMSSMTVLPAVTAPRSTMSALPSCFVVGPSGSPRSGVSSCSSSSLSSSSSSLLSTDFVFFGFLSIVIGAGA